MQLLDADDKIRNEKSDREPSQGRKKSSAFVNRMMICLKFINQILYGPIPANLCLMVLKEGQPCDNLPISANLRSAAREFHSEALN